MKGQVNGKVQKLLTAIPTLQALETLRCLRERRFSPEGKTVAEKATTLHSRLYGAHTAKLAFFVVLAAVSIYFACVLGAEAALAQGEYSGDAVHTTLENIRNYIASILLLLGGIGFAVSLGLKAIAGPNENMHHASHLGMKGSAIAVIGGAILGPLMDIIQGLAASGGGGGGGG